jgi:hypothetical protein
MEKNIPIDQLFKNNLSDGQEQLNLGAWANMERLLDGKNPYADCPGYDPKVTDLLQDVAKRHALPAEDVDLAEAMHEVKELLRKLRSAKMRSA